MVDWPQSQSLDWEPSEIFAEKLPSSLCMLSDIVGVLSKDFRTISGKLDWYIPFLPRQPIFKKMNIREEKTIGK